ncbi:MAG: hypothetical protein ACYDB0_00635 [Acidithiobacillus sp.]
MSTYKTIIHGQEVEVTVIDPVEVDRTRQEILMSNAPVMPVGETCFTDKDDKEHRENDGVRKVPLQTEDES